MDDRVLFGNVKPYFAPASLDQLEGPRGGVIAMLDSVLWSPGGGEVDLDVPGGAYLVYQALLYEGTVEVQERLLNGVRLVEWWPRLRLPAHVRALWEGKFPELEERRAA